MATSLVPKIGAVGTLAQLATDANGNVTGLVGANDVIPVAFSGNKIAIIGNSIVTQCLPYATTTTRWATGASKSISDAVVPCSYTGTTYGIKYVCTVAGTTASSYADEPEWPTTIGGTVTDGTVTWEAQADGDIYYGSVSDWWFWAQARSGQRLRESFIAGLSGKQWASIAQLKQRVIDSGAGVVFLPSVFINDIWTANAAGSVANITAAYASWESFCDDMRLSGRKLIVTTELPNGNIDCNGTVFTGYLASRGGTKNWYWLNDKIRAYALRYSDSVYLIDFANIYLDTNPANPVWPDNATTYTTNAGSTQKLTDGVHPSAAGAQLIAQKIAAFIEANFPAVDHFGNGAGSSYDKDPNPANYGTAGTAGAGTTGDVATSLTVTPYGTTGAIAASKVARTDVSGSYQHAVYTATAGDNAELTWYKAAAASGLTAGNIIELIAETKIAANPTALSSLSIHGRIYGVSNPQWMRAGFHVSTDAELGQFVTADTTFTLRTPGFVVNTGFTGASLYNKVNARAIAASVTIDYGRRVMREVDTPALA